MRKTLLTGLVVGLLTIVMAVPALASNGKAGEPHGRPDSSLQITVTGGSNPGVVYDSIVTAENLPMKGPFQQLITTGPTPTTEFGPGDRGYVGGRWWVDANNNGEMDAEDVFFLCPLLGPGH